MQDSSGDKKVDLKAKAAELKQAQPGEQGYKPPAELVPLPSRGLVYPADHPLYMKDSVEIYPMTAKEEDILTSRALLKQGKAISALLKSCLVDKNIDPDQLLIGDRNAILLAVRITGYGREYAVEVSCPACQEKFEHTFDLANLPIKRLSDSPLVDGTNQFRYELPVSKKEVIFRLLTGHDESDIDQTEKKMKKALGIGAIENSVTTRLRYHILSISGEKDGGKLSHMIRYMPAGDSKSFREHVEDISPGIDMVQWVNCLSCGEQSEVEVPLGVGFLWPSRKR